VSDAVSADALARAAGSIDFRDEARFDECARRGKGDWVRGFVVEKVIEPIALSSRLHVNNNAFATDFRQANV
jgi:hypothetical protein